MNPFLAALEGVGITVAVMTGFIGAGYMIAAAEKGRTWAIITLTVIVVTILGSIVGLGMNGYLK